MSLARNCPRLVLLILSFVSIGLPVTSSVPCHAQNSDQYIHPNARITADLPSPIFEEDEVKPITYVDAAAFAFERLMNRGVENPVICEATWIAAPLGGYLVDALGSWQQDGTTYSVFRIGVHDGASAQNGDEYAAGREFVFLALGQDTLGNHVWYPPPGPDHELAEGEAYDMMLPYEFLLWRDSFESLPARFPIR